MRTRTRPGSRVTPRTALGAACIALLLLAGCAPEPLPHWQAPIRAAETGVTLIAPNDAADRATEKTESAVPLRLTPDLAELQRISDQLAPMRVRHDGVQLAARFAYVPGVPAFNTLMNDAVRAAIDEHGGEYTPQVHGTDAGLATRGCVPGSSTWAASEVLRNPETGPAGHTGTALVCELLGAHDDTLVLAVRTVSGTPEAVIRDHVRTLFVNVRTGEVHEGQQQWRQTAAPELWNATISELRRAAGALSSAATLPPDAAQTQLAATALNSARQASDGGLIVTFAPGLQAPELTGLGIAATTEPVSVAITRELAWEWATDHRRALLSGSVAPFTGVTASWQSVPIDCALLPCVAVTYDDGPGPATGELLATLNEQRGLATLYMLGNAAQAHPETVRLVAKAGHELGSHTMSHPDLTLLSPPEARAQVHHAAQILRDLSGQAVATYRPPYGALTDEVAAEIDMPAILWRIDTNDWRRPGAEALVERSVPVAHPGDIILFHDIHADTVAAAGQVYEGLHERGFVTVTVTQLFGGAVPNAVLRGR